MIEVVWHYELPSWGIHWCRIKLFIRSVSFYSSILVLTMVTIVRCHAVTKSTQWKLTWYKAIIIVVSGIMLGSLQSLLDINENSSTLWQCTGMLSSRFNKVDKTVVFVNMVIVFVGIFTSIACSFAMFCYLKFRPSKAVGTVNYLSILSLKTGFFITLSMLLSYFLPFFPAFVDLRKFDKEPWMWSHILGVSTVLSYIHSMLNPIIFLIGNKALRKSIRNFGKEINSSYREGSRNPRQ